MQRFSPDEAYFKFLSRSNRRMIGSFGQDMQAMYERQYFTELSELAQSRFKWRGLPKTVDPRFLERTLFFNGLALAYTRDEYEGLLIHRASPSGRYNATDNPTRFNAYGNNLRAKNVSAKDCVPIWANYSRVSDVELIRIYAHRLATVDMTLDINSRNARRTKVVVADENTRGTMTNVARQIDEGQPVIFLSRGLEEGELNAIDMGVDPKGVEVMHIYRVRLMNEFMSKIGVQSANQDKTERLVEGEIDANAEQTELNKQRALNARVIAAEQINEKFSHLLMGEKLSVDFVTNQATMSPVEGM